MRPLDVVVVGRVVDGSGTPGFDGWIGVNGDTVVAVETAAVAPPASGRVIDVHGSAVAPGFIDVHTHSDLTAVAAPSMDSALRQGVTTVIVGNCGSSPAPLRQAASAAELLSDVVQVEAESSWASFGEYLDAVQAVRPAVNVAALVGFGTLRRLVLDDAGRPARPEEATAMREQLRRALDAGAVGLSTGLIYEPDQHAPTAEIIAVAEALAERGIYASHVRGEGAPVLRSVAEALTIGRRSGARVQVSHVKCESRHAWGRMPELLELIRDARREGVHAWADVYPYAAYETGLAAFLPPWALPERLPSIMSSRTERRRLRATVESGEPGWQSSIDGVGWDRIVVDHHADPDYEGRDLAELAGERDVLELVAELLARDPQTLVIGHAMQEQDVRTAVAAPDVIIASDGVAVPPDGPLGELKLHPRCWGTFPRVLGHYVREERLIGLEAAVHKMTALPAAQFGLPGRGLLHVGARADLVVFDPRTVAGPADFGSASAPPLGVHTVLVNGTVAWEDGRPGERAGRVLR
jgi:N-acyl-D-aspartate/D-glutamate deacylase